MNENGGIPEAPPVALVEFVPIITVIPTDSCHVGVSEELDPVTGATFRDLIVIHPGGQRYNLRFANLERARQVGRALIKHTPKDERGDPRATATPLADSMKQYLEKGGTPDDSGTD